MSLFFIFGTSFILVDGLFLKILYKPRKNLFLEHLYSLKPMQVKSSKANKFLLDLSVVIKTFRLKLKAAWTRTQNSAICFKTRLSFKPTTKGFIKSLVRLHTRCTKTCQVPYSKKLAITNSFTKDPEKFHSPFAHSTCLPTYDIPQNHG